MLERVNQLRGKPETPQPARADARRGRTRRLGPGAASDQKRPMPLYMAAPESSYPYVAAFLQTAGLKLVAQAPGFVGVHRVEEEEDDEADGQEGGGHEG